VGPESSGKTTLARQLSSNFGCSWVPEYAREYLEGLGRGYDEDDLKLIADRQLEAILKASTEQLPASTIQLAAPGFQLLKEQNTVLSFQMEDFGDHGRPLVIVDSGMLSLRLWARIKFGKEIPVVEEALKYDSTSMYLLCRPLVPWEPDPLREAPLLLDRVWIYNHYLMELAAIQAK
jgi:nicotinamide riboside kinase